MMGTPPILPPPSPRQVNRHLLPPREGGSLSRESCYLDRVVQGRRGWVERKILKGLDVRLAPAFLLAPFHREHVVREVLAKDQLARVWYGFGVLAPFNLKIRSLEKKPGASWNSAAKVLGCPVSARPSPGLETCFILLLGKSCNSHYIQFVLCPHFPSLEQIPLKARA